MVGERGRDPFTRSPTFGLTTATPTGNTLTTTMNIPSDQMGATPRRYQSVWTKQ